MTIFISQPMGGKSHEEIEIARQEACEKIQLIFSGAVDILDTNFNFPGKSPLYYLAKSIEALCQADMAYFMKGWENNRGCRIEHACCQEYHIPIMYEN